jgi:hypothetical protein
MKRLNTAAIEKATTDQEKVKAAALAMIETPLDLIKHILLKHEEAVIEVMGELYQQQQGDEALLRRCHKVLTGPTCHQSAEWLELTDELERRLA